MNMLVAAGIAFLAIHLVISGTQSRDGIVSAIGEGPYMGLFALASLATLVWLAISYNAASMSSENRVLYDLGRGVRDSGILIIAVAFLLGVQGLLMPNPTAVRQGAAAAKEANIKGVLRITRHPFLWGVVIWSAFHRKSRPAFLDRGCGFPHYSFRALLSVPRLALPERMDSVLRLRTRKRA